MNIWLYLTATTTLSLVLTAGLRRYAIKKNIIDIPNSRSSHIVPTPRGGGVAIVISFVVANSLLFLFESINLSDYLTIMGAGILVSGIGFIDDHRHVSARWRLLAHFIAALWVLFCLDGGPTISVFGLAVNSVYLSSVFAFLYLVWMINLYNFMDGIDALASVQAITVTLSMSYLYWISGLDSLIWIPLILAAAVTGFLCFNFPPARIFMGDAGSGFIGLILAILSLQGGMVTPEIFWGWLIMMGVFIVDATYTLFRRFLNGAKIYEAHRSHAYQSASRLHNSHGKVTSFVAMVNLAWLFPLAALVVVTELDGSLILVVAYIPLIAMAHRYHAGRLGR
ncbi:Fuc2NAc and GlcNAc transferase [Pseudomonas brassicacearum]|uniref:Fuc2NAc and GlcNAc transferase n=1 Tax=Pseudomonas brassicacearum TaxID=930166 RepID=A0AAW8M3H4_9PSED|nr:glycosyltransferase family 4 protein [Pseudomonas brassicacearum]MDR6956356.1 Fuc2NAc and GlcNAc transferase [Pseudomonas brassicacearum]